MHKIDRRRSSCQISAGNYIPKRKLDVAEFWFAYTTRQEKSDEQPKNHSPGK